MFGGEKPLMWISAIANMGSGDVVFGQLYKLRRSLYAHVGERMPCRLEPALERRWEKNSFEIDAMLSVRAVINKWFAALM